MFDGHMRAPIEKAVKPIGDRLRRTRLTPDHLTIAGLVVAALAAVAIGLGWFALGLLLVVLAALPDLLDGALAKASNSSSQRGAFFDSVIDRVTDALLFGGVAWYFASEESPHLTILPMAVALMSGVISYQRAKAESLGCRPRAVLWSAPSGSFCCVSACSSRLYSFPSCGSCSSW
ncbi:MAG: CDP-alcohol phosphatidyltransferase family protein [Ilumatobacteraceae bacterium]